jgi:peroxiredoxin-like protein
MSITHFYDVSLQWNQGRIGTMSSSVLPQNLEVATPPEFPQGVPGIWSPEHLLIAAVNGCLMTTFLAIAENSKLDFEAFHSKASGKLEMIDGKYLISEITLSPSLTIKDEQYKEKAERILVKSEAACLISNSLKSKIILEPTILISSALV